MPPTLEELGLLRLSPEDRLAVAQALWEVVEQEAIEELSDELRAELERRAAESDADPNGGIPWEVVKAEALSRLRS